MSNDAIPVEFALRMTGERYGTTAADFDGVERLLLEAPGRPSVWAFDLDEFNDRLQEVRPEAERISLRPAGR